MSVHDISMPPAVLIIMLLSTRPIPSGELKAQLQTDKDKAAESSRKEGQKQKAEEEEKEEEEVEPLQFDIKGELEKLLSQKDKGRMLEPDRDETARAPSQTVTAVSSARLPEQPKEERPVSPTQLPLPSWEAIQGQEVGQTVHS